MIDGNKQLELNSINVDYLRLTTYSPELYDYWVESIKDLLAAIDATPKVTDTQVMQYHGTRVDCINTFVGEGKQNIKGMKNTETHFLIDVAGWFANYLYPYIQKETLKWDSLFRVPRIDVQKTIDLETFFHCFKCEPNSLLIDMVNSEDGSWIGRKPVLSFHSDLSIGLGNRKSLQYRRIYRKTKEPETIRFETEWHNAYASQVFKNGVTNYYNKSWTNMPQQVDMARFLGSSEPVQWVRLPSERANKAIWLVNSVWPSIISEVAIYDGIKGTNYGIGIKQSLDTIIAIIDRLDKNDK